MSPGQSCRWTIQAPTESRIVGDNSRCHISTAAANEPPMIWLINSLGTFWCMKQSEVLWGQTGISVSICEWAL